MPFGRDRQTDREKKKKGKKGSNSALLMNCASAYSSQGLQISVLDTAAASTEQDQDEDRRAWRVSV